MPRNCSCSTATTPGPISTGFTPKATAFAAGSTVIPNATKIDVIGAAMTQNALAEQPVTGVVVHPSDSPSMRMLKSIAGEYIMGPPGR